MTWIDPGEFGRAAAAREDTRMDCERAILDRLLAAGWNSTTAGEARRLQEAMAAAVSRAASRTPAGVCNETALGLVGEARGAAVAEWWAQTHGLDDRTRELLRECAAAAAAMAMIDGFHLGRDLADGARTVQPSPRAAATLPDRRNGASTNGARVPALA